MTASGSSSVPPRRVRLVHQEAAHRSHLYGLCTAAAGVTIGATNVYSSVGPATPILGIFNPLGSGKKVIISSVDATWNSGTAGAGGLVIAVLAAATISAASGTTTVNQTTGLSGASSGSVVSSYVNAAITGQSGACTLAQLLGGPSVGAISANSPMSFCADVDGTIIILPGNFAGVFAAAVGTSPIVTASMLWEEF